MEIRSRLKEWVVRTLDISNAPSVVDTPVASGVTVNQGKVLGIPAAWQAMRAISSAVAASPVTVMREKANVDIAEAPERAEHRLNELFENSPLPDSNIFNWLETLSLHLLLRGNGYILPDVQESTNQPVFLNLLQPDKVQIQVSNNTLTYLYNGQPIENQRNLLHIKGMSYDGVQGVSPIRAHRDSFGMAIATSDYGQKYFGRGGRPLGFLNSEEPVGPADRTNIVEEWDKGVLEGSTPLLDGTKLTYESISIPPEDAQFLETRIENIRDIARIYNIPLSKLRENSRSTYSNIYQESLDFVSETIRPFVTRIEKAFDAHFLTERDEQGAVIYPDGYRYFVKFDLNHLLASDPLDESRRLKELVSAGIITPNEAREELDKPPIDGGDELASSSTAGQMLDAAMQTMNPEENNDEPEPGN